MWKCSHRKSKENLFNLFSFPFILSFALFFGLPFALVWLFFHFVSVCGPSVFGSHSKKNTNEQLWSKGKSMWEQRERKVKRKKMPKWKSIFSFTAEAENTHFRFRSTNIPFVNIVLGKSKTSSSNSYSRQNREKKRIELNTKQKQSAPNNHAHNQNGRPR